MINFIYWCHKNGLYELDYPVNIQNTKQYVIYELLNDYNYNWEYIKWKE
jgi:hypothetical protein